MVGAYRHGLDFVSDVASALVLQAGDVNAARRARASAAETGPVSEEAQNLPEDNGLLARVITSPVSWVFTGLVVLALVAARGLYGSGTLTGGALLPAPDSALDWWRLHLDPVHDLGAGSTAPAAPYVLPLAVAGTVLLGKAWLVVDLLFLMAVPLAAFGAYRFLRRVTSSLPMSLWGAVAYGVLPVVTGAVQEGRLGTVAGILVLPWLAHAALFLGPGHDEDRRRRAARHRRPGGRQLRDLDLPDRAEAVARVPARGGAGRRDHGRGPRRHRHPATAGGRELRLAAAGRRAGRRAGSGLARRVRRVVGLERQRRPARPRTRHPRADLHDRRPAPRSAAASRSSRRRAAFGCRCRRGPPR